MSENEPSAAESSSEGSTDVCSSDGENYYVFNCDFAPYQSKPLASSEDGELTMAAAEITVFWPPFYNNFSKDKLL